MHGVSPNQEPLVLFDGNQMSLPAGLDGMSPTIQFLNSLNPREIEYIEVFKGTEAATYGLRGGNGVIYIHSSSVIHQDFIEAGAGNAFKFLGKGYALPVLFPMPNYGLKSTSNSLYKDIRSTLYWNENELVNKDGKANFFFYTNDLPGHYQVIINGITVHGDLIYKQLSFVNK
jgi:hypothetical protein